MSDALGGLGSLGMIDPMVMARLALMSGGLGLNNPQAAPGQFSDQNSQLPQAAEAVGGANQEANEAATRYQNLAGQPMPQVAPGAQSLGLLLGNTASVLGGNASYSQEAHQRILQQRQDLLQSRAQALQAAKDDFDRKAFAATWLGRVDIAGQYRDQAVKLGKELQGILDTQNNDMKEARELEVEAAKHGYRMDELKLKGQTTGTGALDESMHEFAQGLIEGKIPPNPSLVARPTQYTVKLMGAIHDIDPTFNLTKASLDYGAHQTFIRTLNGRQQVQIRQSANTVIPALDKLQDLTADLEKLIPRSNVKAWDQLSVGAAKDWAAFGPEAQGVAAQLRAQAVTIVPELANIYQAGGVPTEQAMKLAEQAIDPKGTPNQLRAQIALARKNLVWKTNAIQATVPLDDQGQPSIMPGSPNPSGPDALLAGDKLRAKYFMENDDLTGFTQWAKDHPSIQTDPDVYGWGRKLLAAKNKK
jgi:hypothetical protein